MPVHIALLLALGCLVGGSALGSDFTYKPGLAVAPEPDDRADQIADRIRFSTLQEMDRNGLKSGQVQTPPWSGDYWPMYAGLIARRYTDPNLPKRMNWVAHRDHFDVTSSRFRSGSPDDLSPAEKYDLLVGDSDFSLTRAMWNEGKAFFDQYGKVDYWMGICNGWSAAALNTPRPVNAVTVTAADGVTRIRFYPSDIKALTSLLWARGYGQYRSIGKRCAFENPPRSGIGRAIPAECLDTNPATWHLGMVNQVGALKRSLVMDLKANSEVWNHPIYSYRYSYFNPKTGQDATTLEGARVETWAFPEDIYKRHRSPLTHSVVGVEMEVLYVNETQPDHSLPDSISKDLLERAVFFYDLELDSQGRIVGGEWYTDEHPDFLWAPKWGTGAYSEGDFALERSGDFMHWNGLHYPFPRVWMNIARASSRRSQPLERVVRTLVEMSASRN